MNVLTINREHFRLDGCCYVMTHGFEDLSLGNSLPDFNGIQASII